MLPQRDSLLVKQKNAKHPNRAHQPSGELSSVLDSRVAVLYVSLSGSDHAKILLSHVP